MPKLDPRNPEHQVNNMTLPPGLSKFPLKILTQPARVTGRFILEPKVNYIPEPENLMTFGEAVQKLWEGKYNDAAAIKSFSGPVMVLYRKALRRGDVVKAKSPDALIGNASSIWTVDNRGIVVFPDEDTAVAGVITKHIKKLVLP